MTFRVFWSPHAEQSLEHILLDDKESELLVAAARTMDRQLAANPLTFGESRFETVRVGFVRPLGIQFEVLDDVQTVIVYDVWRIDRR